ncbi:hypothetical protein [Sphingobacterium sp. SYP-B4668]|uniref:hypothetical protein n=1 Tax=Sphingobacterium sp. SYP-B4668 TaxID=2996035 RepID=UPI0022DD2864|nr:hypothetical protein [Sphingobacterium sp. SYP-B4668]
MMIFLIITIFDNINDDYMDDNRLIGVITGDLINSRKTDVKIWLPLLEDALDWNTHKYDIYRGDSFQAEIDLEHIFHVLFYIKARLKTIKNMDVRMSIGVGHLTFSDKHVKTSSGEAYINAGESFDLLKKETLTIKTPWQEMNEILDLLLQLSAEIADRWTENMAESVAMALRYPDKSQVELAQLLNRKYQSQVSTELNKAGYFKIQRVIDYCKLQILERCSIRS